MPDEQFSKPTPTPRLPVIGKPVLGIESSCDETGVAILRWQPEAPGQGLLAHALYSQVKLHADYGGVVPELASRDHIRKLLPLLRQTLADADLTVSDLSAVAYTAGPGLIGALLVGASVARSLAWALEVPAIGVHHMEGHLLAPLLEEPTPGTQPLAPPFVALLVSGGHSLLVGVDKIGSYTILGDTLDDAAGEAFDKTAKLMGLPYPGGPALAKLAETGDPKAFRFSRPMTARPGLDFSFSGLKTQVLMAWRDSDHADATKADIARGFEEAIVETLAIKCRRSASTTWKDTFWRRCWKNPRPASSRWPRRSWHCWCREDTRCWSGSRRSAATRSSAIRSTTRRARLSTRPPN